MYKLKLLFLLRIVFALTPVSTVEYHNQLRTDVANGNLGFPSASNMNKLYWDENLAAVAQTWSDSCNEVGWNHNDDRSEHYLEISGEDSYIGENIAWTSGTYNDYAQSGVDLWWREYNDYDYELDACSDECGHFLQMAYADTNRLGCGVTTGCDFGSGPGSYLVCNYAPGRYSDRPVYISGDIASDCVDGSEDGLCIDLSQETQNIEVSSISESPEQTETETETETQGSTTSQNIETSSISTEHPYETGQESSANDNSIFDLLYVIFGFYICVLYLL